MSYCTLCPEKCSPITFVNSNVKSYKLIVKIFAYKISMQNVTEIIMHFCSITTFSFLPLLSCLLTVPRCHRSSAADASQLWEANVCQGTLQTISSYHTFSCCNIVINFLPSFDVIFQILCVFFCTQTLTSHPHKLSVHNLDDGELAHF